MRKWLLAAMFVMVVLVIVAAALAQDSATDGDAPVGRSDDPNPSAPPDAGSDQLPVAMVDCIVGGRCVGTSGHDTITASDLQDEITALEGDDQVEARGGNDRVLGGDGADTIDTQDGEADTVDCGPGEDTVAGDEADVINHDDCENVTLSIPSPGS